ncbi:MAG: HAD family phosphatase [Bacteroidaceae bacterium]|nr:HAD family phosphatase [Bacteroidaceae bacterium]
MGKLKACLFDLDGTLFDTEGQYTVIWSAIGKKYRPDIPDLAQVIKGTTLKQIMERYFPDENVQKKVCEELDEYEAQMRYEFIDGARDFLDDLRSHGIKCAVVTSSNMKKMNCVARQMPEFNTLFDRVLTSEDFAASKPNPDCYLLGARVFDAALDECLVFEDAFTGLQAGTSAGIFTVGLATYNSREAIQDRCDYVIDNFVGMTYDKAAHLLER